MRKRDDSITKDDANADRDTKGSWAGLNSLGPQARAS